MKRFKKLGVVIVALAMCALLGISVWAANTLNVTYTASLDKETICKTGVEQTVKLTVKVDSKVAMDSFTAQVTVPNGLELVSISFGDLENAFYEKTNGMIMWWAEDTINVSNDLIAEVTVKVPANVEARSYSFGFEIIGISSDYGVVWETGETLAATLTVAAEHSYTTKASEKLATAADCTNPATYYVQCDNCDAVSTEKTVPVGSANGHSFNSKASQSLATAADCTNPATYYVQCDNCAAVSDTKTVPDGEAKGHDYQIKDYTFNDDDTHTANYVCGNDESHTKSETVDHDFTNGDCVCGAAALKVVKKGDTISYTVSGRVVTVTCASACKVGYLNDDKYVPTGITMTANQDGSYSFTIPASVSEVLIVVKGDANGDGRINVADKTQVNAVALRKTTFSAEATFAADVNSDGRINVADKTQVNAVALRKTAFEW